MNFEEAMSRTATGRVTYLYQMPNPDGGKELMKHEITLTLLPSGLADAHFTIEEQLVDWPKMLHVAQVLEIPVASMQARKQGRDTGRSCDVCSFSVSQRFPNITACDAAAKMATLGVSLEKSWFPA